MHQGREMTRAGHAGAAALLLLAAAAALAQCGGNRPPKPVTFACREGPLLFATFTPGHVAVDVQGRTYELPQTIAGSGARYSDGSVVFWNKGSTALFMQPGGPDWRDCVLLPPT